MENSTLRLDFTKPVIIFYGFMERFDCCDGYPLASVEILKI